MRRRVFRRPSPGTHLLTRRWWLLTALLVVPCLVFTQADSAFSGLTSSPPSAWAAANLDTYLPGTFTATRTGATQCRLAPSGYAAGNDEPSGLAYEITNQTTGDVDSKPYASTGSVDVTVSGTQAVTMGVKVGYRSWRSRTSTTSTVCAAALDAPTNVTVFGDDAALEVRWAGPATTGSSPVQYYTATATPGGATCKSVTTTCSIPGLTNGTAYSVTVTATNSEYTGAASSPAVSGTPQKAGLLVGFGDDSGAAMALGTSSSHRPLTVTTGGYWTSLAASNAGGCGVANSTSYVMCWGKGASPTLGDTVEPVLVDAHPYTQIDGEGDHRCGVRTDKTLWCWGDNTRGQAGGGDTNPRTAPALADTGSTKWSSVTTGAKHSCAIDTAQHLWCWGDNSVGQLANGTGTSASSPLAVGNATWSSVSAGGDSTCAIKATDKTLWCWGQGSSGQLGAGGSTLPRGSMTQANPDTDWSSVQMTGTTACGIKTAQTTGYLFCWGSNGSNQVGPDSLGATVNTPTRVDSTTDWTAVAPGGDHVCGVRAAAVWCWGNNSVGQLGNGRTHNQDRPGPQQVASGYTSNIMSGSGFSCAEHTWSGLQCWGDNTFGQLASRTMRAIPYPADGTWIDGDVGGTNGHTCVIKADASLTCGGENTYGEVGNGKTEDLAPAAQVDGGSWMSVATGEDHTCGVKADTTLWCWGRNNVGQLGTGDAAALQSKPVSVGGSDWLRVSSFSNSTCAVKSSGTLWCWGSGAQGQLGQNSYDTLTVPTQVGSSAVWRSVGVGPGHVCATTSGGDLYCWGANGAGQLGDGTATTRLVPTPVAGSRKWRMVSTGGSVDAGSSSTCAIDDSEHLWCWGANDSGQLGTGGTTPASSPVQIGTRTYRDISVGDRYACAVDTNRKVWCWGRGGSGQLGAGSSDAVSPRQVPGVSAPHVVTGMASTLLLRATAAPPGPPVASPYSGSVTSGTKKFTVSWSRPTATGGSPLISTTAHVKLADGTGSVLTCSTTGTSCDVTGLTSGALYSVWMDSTNANGTGNVSLATWATPN